MISMSTWPYHAQRQLRPEEDLLKDLDASFDPDKWPMDRPPDPESNLLPSTIQSPTDILTNVIRHSGSLVTTSDEAHDDDLSNISMADNLKHLSIDPIEHRFFGQSSGYRLVQAAIDLKEEYIGTPKQGSTRRIFDARRIEFWNIRPVRNTLNFHVLTMLTYFLCLVGETVKPCRDPVVYFPGRRPPPLSR